MGSNLKVIAVWVFLLFLITSQSNALIPEQQYFNSEQKYSKILATPYYRQSMNQNINYTYVINIEPPDNVKEVKSAIISFLAYINPTVTVNIWVNSIPCNTASYTVSTTYSGAGQSLMSFDCTNQIKKEGKYNITLRSSGANIGSSVLWSDLTFSNKKISNDPKFILSGTEYQIGEMGKLFLQLDNSGIPINNASCYVNIYYPNNSIFRNRQAMTNLFQSDGIYYYDVQIPNVTGVYMLSAFCEFSLLQYYLYNPNRPPYAQYLANLSTLRGTIDPEHYNFFAVNENDDNLYIMHRSTAAGTRWSNQTYLFNLSKATIPFLNWTSMTVFWEGSSDKAVTIRQSVYNYTSGKYEELKESYNLAARATGTAPAPVDDILTNTVPFNNDFIQNESVRFMISVDSGGTTHFIWTDFVNVLFNVQSEVVQEVKGSSEWQVSGSSEDIIKNITAYLSQIAGDLNRSINLTNSNLISINLSISEKIGNITFSGIIPLIWNYENRTLTSFNLTQLNITLNSPPSVIQQEGNFTLSISECPLSSSKGTKSMLLIFSIFMLFGIVSYLLKAKIAGFISGFGIISVSAYIYSCSYVMGIITTCTGILMCSYFLLNKRFKND